MTLSELETFMTDNGVLTLTLISHINGWQIGLRARPGSPLHLREAGAADSYRMAHGATVPDVFSAMVALVPIVSDSSEDDLFA
jgi:hypothetical protein